MLMGYTRVTDHQGCVNVLVCGLERTPVRRLGVTNSSSYPVRFDFDLCTSGILQIDGSIAPEAAILPLASSQHTKPDSSGESSRKAQSLDIEAAPKNPVKNHANHRLRAQSWHDTMRQSWTLFFGEKSTRIPHSSSMASAKQRDRARCCWECNLARHNLNFKSRVAEFH